MLKQTITVVFRSLYTSVAFLAIGFILLLATSLFLSPPHGTQPPLIESIVGVTVLYILVCAPLSLVLYFLKGKSAAVVPFVLFAMLLIWVMTFYWGGMPVKDNWYTLLIWNASWLTLLLSFIVSAVNVVRNKIYGFPLVFFLSIPLTFLLIIKIMALNSL